MPNTIIIGKTVIGENCTIGPNSYIDSSVIGNDVVLDNSKILDSTIEDGADCGPFVKVRAKSVLKKGVHIGNFVEVKNSIVGEGTKSAHLTYIGDSDVGSGVNFGCGTVTCNYDGKTRPVAQSATAHLSVATQILLHRLMSATGHTLPQAQPLRTIFRATHYQLQEQDR